MKEYLKLLEELQSAVVKDNRTGISASSKFFNHMEFDLAKSFPAVTTKQLYIKAVIGELIGFFKGSTDNQDFLDLKCKVWNDNANEDGVDANGNVVPNKWLTNPFRKGHNDLGKIYGYQWRKWDHTTYLTQEEHAETLFEDENSIRTMHNVMTTELGYTYMGWLDPEYTNDEEVHNGLHVYRKRCDQLADAIHKLETDPLNRRIIISGWNPGDLDKMALPPCHVLQHWQCMPLTMEERIKYGHDNIENFEQLLDEIDQHVEDDLNRQGIPKYSLNLLMYQRSCDTVLGLPFNVSSYAVMAHIMCRITGHALGKFHYVTGDTHIYGNHDAAVEEQLAREPMENHVRLKIADHLRTLEDFENASPDDFELIGYKHHGPLENETPMAI